MSKIYEGTKTYEDSNFRFDAVGSINILNSDEYTGAPEEAIVLATIANAEATLYLGEQQRIANLIALYESRGMNIDHYNEIKELLN